MREGVKSQRIGSGARRAFPQRLRRSGNLVSSFTQSIGADPNGHIAFSTAADAGTSACDELCGVDGGMR
jgi:hypothetical protein